MNDKPKDRTTKRMNIIAISLVLINALGNLIYRIVTGEDVIVALLYPCLVFLVIALRRKAVAGFFFLIFGLLVIIFVGIQVFTGEYETLRYEIFSFSISQLSSFLHMLTSFIKIGGLALTNSSSFRLGQKE